MKKLFFTQFLLFISSLTFVQSITLTLNNVGVNMEGRMCYDNVAKEFRFWYGKGVRAMEGSGGSGVGWALSSTHLHNTNAGNLGIGISTPNERLHLHNAATGNTH